jgi:hypothetical protein
MKINISKALTSLILPVVFYIAVSAFTESAETGRTNYSGSPALQNHRIHKHDPEYFIQT